MRQHYPLNPNGDEDAGLLPWIDGVPSSGQEGSYPGNKLFVDMEAEVLAAQDAAGLPRSGADLTQLAQAISRGLYLGGFSGSANALSATLPGNVKIPAPLAGMRFTATAPQTNTGSVTLTISGFTQFSSAASLLRRNGTALTAGDVPVGVPFQVMFDGSAFRFTAPVNSEIAPPSTVIYRGDDTSTSANTITVPTLDPALTAYEKGATFVVKLKTTNTGTTQANLGGRGLKSVVRADGSALKNRDILANQELILVYDGTNLQVAGLNPIFIPGNVLEILTTPGSGTYTVPEGIYRLEYELDAGGGGGGGCLGAVAAGSGGGGGENRRGVMLVTPGQQIPYTVGAAGAAGSTAPSNGGNGGSTSFGTAVAIGGGGGLAGNGGIQSGGAGAGGTGGSGGIGNAGGAGGIGFLIDGNPVSGQSGYPGRGGSYGLINITSPNGASSGSYPASAGNGASGQGGLAAPGQGGRIILRSV